MNSPVSQRRAAATADPEARDRLLDATHALIAEGGIEALTSRAITDRAELNLGSITYYFGSKEALVAESLARTARRLITPVLDVLTEPDADPTVKLFEAVQLLGRTVATDEAALHVYVQAMAAAAHLDDVAGPLRSVQTDIVGTLEAELVAMRADERIPEWVRPAAMAQLIVALVNGVALGVSANRPGTSPVDIGQQFAALLVHVQPDTGWGEG